MIAIELFGCSGGMAEGFNRAGIDFDVVIDADPDACESYGTNLGHRPIRVDVRDLLRLLGYLAPAQPVGLIVADPPCTPWSRAGRRRGLDDERDVLAETIELLERLRPVAWLIGNVPGLDDSDNWRKVVQPVIGGFAKRAGYCVDYARLDAADYGVPQHRRRPFWYGHRQGTPCIRWPSPTHGDWSTMRLDDRKPWVTCRDALEHLPVSEIGRPVRLRWKGGVSGADHRPSRPSRPSRPGRTVTGNTDGDGALLAHPKHPISEPDAPARTITCRDTGGAQGARCLAVRPHHRTDPDRPGRVITATDDDARLLEWPWERPATTVAMDDRIGPPGHHTQGQQLSHPDAVKLSEEAAAILQGFPEGWVFAGKTKRSRWSQIGQATPPPLAEAVARSIVEQMGLKTSRACGK